MMARGCAVSYFGLDQGRYQCAMAYGSRAGADIPQRLAGKRGEASERCGADLAFGQLPIGLEGIVWKPGDKR